MLALHMLTPLLEPARRSGDKKALGSSGGNVTEPLPRAVLDADAAHSLCVREAGRGARQGKG